MDEMEWSQAKRIALDIYGNTEIDGDKGDNGDTKNNNEKQGDENLKPDVMTIEKMIETEDDALDWFIDDMLAILPRVEEEYLVSGARLKCSLATWATIYIDGVKFNTNKDGTSLLKVENRDMIGDVSKANIFDCKKYKNIMPFGNCKAELSEDEKKMLKANVIARHEGMCYCLMNISGLWENEPTKGGIEYFKYHGYPGINGMSKLFCYKKGKIMALTSGQENRNLSVSPSAVTKEDLQFAIRNGVGGKKIYALADIRKKYFDENAELLETTTIFVFEGLADEWPHGKDSKWNGDNKYHPNGQFGAIIFVAKEGKLTYYEAHASTLPDNMEKKATICDGIYDINNGSHSVKGGEPYAALWLENNGKIPAYNSIDFDDDANFIHFHMAGPISNTSNYSAGCITIPVRDYVAFGKHVGFLNKNTDDSIGNDDNYIKAAYNLEFGLHTEKFEGKIVIDRQYYEDTEGYLKFNSSEKMEGNQNA